MFRFAHPYYLFLLLALGAAAWLVYRRRVRQGLLFAPLGRLGPRRAGWQALARAVSPALFLLGVAAAIVALARPQTVFSRVKRQADVIAIQMLVDMSGSMQALDFSTRDAYRSRLDVVKQTFVDFVQMRPDDLIGLVTFGGYATTRTPLTIDHHALVQTLKGLEVPKTAYDANGQMLNEEELLTAIGDGLATGCARLKDAKVKSKVIVLLTDGESNTGIIKPEEAMKAAKALGVRVYTIGVGTTGRAPVIVRDMFGREAVQYMDVRLDEDLLRSIAQATSAKYFNVRDPQALARAVQDINKLERTRVEQEIFEQYNELFPYVLIPGALLILLGAWGNALLTKSMV
jgi:Ca-activated chloride channel homolog